MSESPFLPYARQWLDDEEVEAVARVLRGDWLTTGPRVKEFEKALATVGGCKHGIAVNSGTAALHAGAFALGVGRGDGVVTTPLTFSATANVALHLGATVRFADVEPRTGNLDPASVEASLAPETKLIVPVDFAGHPAAYTELRAVANAKGCALLADAAHSLGAMYRRRPVGSLADATSLSFHPVKPITTGEGGAVLCDDDEVRWRVASFRNHGQVLEHDRQRDPGAPWHRELHHLGLNYRLPDVLCAIGIVQLTKLERFVARRREIAARYLDAWKRVAALELPADLEHVQHAWHLFVLRVRDASRRRAFYDALRARRLGVQVHYEPVYMQPLYRDLGYEPGSCPVAEDFAARAVSVPLFPRMSDDDVNRVCAEVLAVAAEVL